MKAPTRSRTRTTKLTLQRPLTNLELSSLHQLATEFTAAAEQVNVELSNALLAALQPGEEAELDLSIDGTEPTDRDREALHHCLRQPSRWSANPMDHSGHAELDEAK